MKLNKDDSFNFLENLLKLIKQVEDTNPSDKKLSSSVRYRYGLSRDIPERLEERAGFIEPEQSKTTVQYRKLEILCDFYNAVSMQRQLHPDDEIDLDSIFKEVTGRWDKHNPNYIENVMKQHIKKEYRPGGSLYKDASIPETHEFLKKYDLLKIIEHVPSATHSPRP